VRDLAILLLHVLATIARLAGPGGVRAVVAESVLVKQQLLILNRSRKRSPRLRLGDRVVAGLCALHLPGPAGPCRDRPETINPPAPPPSADCQEISSAVLIHSAQEAGPEGSQSGGHRRHRRHEAAEPNLGVSAHRAADHLGLGIPMNKNVVRRILAVRYRPKPDAAGPSWLTVLGHTKDSLWSMDLFRCESAILRAYWVLVVMDQCTRRIVGFGVHRGAVDGAGRRSFKPSRATTTVIVPTRRWRDVHRGEPRLRAASTRVSICFVGSRTVAGCIRRRWRHERGRDALATRKG
jgi:putative transposase